MTNIEFTREIVSIIKRFDTPQQALAAVQQKPVPNKEKRIKKLLCKLIRTYIYITEQA